MASESDIPCYGVARLNHDSGPRKGRMSPNFNHKCCHKPKFYVKKDTRKAKEMVVEKYSHHCPICHKWFSDEQWRGHGHTSSD